MHRLAAFVCFCFLTNSGVLFSQTPELDSLIENLSHYKKQDSLRAQLYLDIAIKLRRIDPNKARPYYDTASQIAEKVNEGVLLVKAANGIAITYGMVGNYPEAIQAFKNTEVLAKKYNQPGRTADALNGLGIVYKRLGDYAQSLEYYAQAIPIYDEVKDHRGLAATYENMGVLHDLMKQPDRAMQSYQKAISIYKNNNESLLVSLAEQNIAVLLIGNEQYEDALKILMRNKRIYDSLNRYPSSIGTGVNIGYIYLKQKQYAKAKTVLQQSLEGARQYEIKQEQVNCLNSLFEIALIENDINKARQYVNEYQQLARELDSKEYIKLSYQLFSKLYEKTGDYQKSLEAYKSYKSWSDSLVSEEKTRAFEAQQVKVEILEKNKQLAEQDLKLDFLEEQVNQQNRIKWLLVIGSLLLLVIMFLLYQKFVDRKRVNDLLTLKNSKISWQKLQIEEINYQLENKMLRAQINPHFIFNSLGSVQHFITIDDKASALKYLGKFSKLMRKVLESSVTGNVLLDEEVQLISMYLELEASRFSNEFSYSIHVDESLDVNSIKIPTMILQPIIENAILHGLLPKEQNKKLDVSFSPKDYHVLISVTDNGIGREASRLLQENRKNVNPSRGLSVTNQRLQTLKEKYGWNIDMNYEDLTDNSGKACGTRVTLLVPIH